MWSSAVDASDRLPRFRAAFAALWMIYDLADIITGGTRDILWISGASTWPLTLLQAALIVGELFIVLGISAPLACVACLILRLVEAEHFFPLNDFHYYCVTMLPLVFAGEKRLWTRTLLLAQLAWIYFATATLKLNSEWLSGGHLYVRQNYLAAIQGWPYPAWYAWFTTLPGCAWLARCGVAAEFLLSLLLLWRRFPRATLALAVSVHLVAALALNVWFFGASMVLEIAFLI